MSSCTPANITMNFQREIEGWVVVVIGGGGGGVVVVQFRKYLLTVEQSLSTGKRVAASIHNKSTDHG